MSDPRLSAYWMAETPCTQALYEAVAGTNTSEFKGDDQRPVEWVSWHGARAFMRALNELVPGLDARFPTEAEWENAYRAGATETAAGGIDDFAWYRGNSDETTHAVKAKRANSLGLHDMLGNVWEWCSDWYSPYSGERQANPRGAATGEGRVLRGGSWDSRAKHCRAAYRYWRLPSSRNNLLGFRLARGQVERVHPLNGPERGAMALPDEEALAPDAASAIGLSKNQRAVVSTIAGAVGTAGGAVAAVAAAPFIGPVASGIPALAGAAAKGSARRLLGSTASGKAQAETETQREDSRQQDLLGDVVRPAADRVVTEVKQVGDEVQAAQDLLLAQHNKLDSHSESIGELRAELNRRLPRPLNVDEELAKVDETGDAETTLILKRARRDGIPIGPNVVLTWSPPKGAPEQRYLLVDRVGRGGFGEVWRALDLTNGNRNVAVKVLHNRYANSDPRRGRFYRGARKQAQLDHPHIVTVHEPVCTDAGYCFFVMEYVEGQDLRRAAAGGFAPELVRKIIADVGGALTYAHRKSLLHRDVKPSNILLNKRGRSYLTDFDLVAAHDTSGGTRTGALGTFIYAAPESMKSAKDADERADVYGLGMTAIYALYEHPELPLEMLRVPEVVLGALNVPEAVRVVLEKSIEWDLSKRHRSMAEFVRSWNKAFESAFGNSA